MTIMKYEYLILSIIILGTFFLAYHYIQYLKAITGTENYARRRAIALLFLAFITMVGISSVFAEAVFEAMGLNKPINYEIISLVGYFIFAFATFKIMEGSKKNNSAGTPITQPSTSDIKNQTIKGDIKIKTTKGNTIFGDRNIILNFNTLGLTIFLSFFTYLCFIYFYGNSVTNRNIPNKVQFVKDIDKYKESITKKFTNKVQEKLREKLLEQFTSYSVYILQEHGTIVEDLEFEDFLDKYAIFDLYKDYQVQSINREAIYLRAN